MPYTPHVRVVVKLPYNRPEQPCQNPPRIEWNAEKANILWEVISLSRASDNGGTDWKGLAAHLQVPLPYLLYRAQARYEEDLRGLQDIKGVLSQTTGNAPKSLEATPVIAEQPLSIRIPTTRPANAPASAARLSAISASGRINTPMGVRARLNSLGHAKGSSSSTVTLQGPRRAQPQLRPNTPPSSDEYDSEDELAAKEEEADRKQEERETLDRKLANLQKVMTSEVVGLVASPVSPNKGKDVIRGRAPIPSSSQYIQESFRRNDTRNRDHSASVSSTSSPQGSIPSIPSPPPESQPQSPMSRHLSTSKSSSPPALSVRNARGKMRYGALVAQANVSEQESNQGSSASSFSDISDASLSASALESALMSNIRGGGSRFSAIAKSRFTGRGVRQ
ncbi:hypothetical protein BJ138DRAFT_1147148 [Hygrophoropsis aurantiaca]|uniref:Uncharacterized protein n=1 Tax=Hygrophoropsis aurantiaca TaxID=72124 RepID=A0ACB8AJP9_9AGAM|nr:hypothetical protein BJ138DRAFT_1147148 [Hygrophoropsis aurantiaca]